MGKDEISINNIGLGNLTSHPEPIINRLKEALDVTSDLQLATYLGISRQNIGAARKRNDVPTGWIYKVAEMTGCSMDWLGFGRGPKRTMATYGEPKPGRRSEFASPQTAYQRRTDPSRPSNGVIEGQEETASFGAAVEMLAKIYNSGDKTIIGAINANIRALCEVLERKQ